MHALATILVLAGLLAFLVGIVAIIRPIRSLGFTRRLEGACLAVASLVLVVLAAQLDPEVKAKTAASNAAQATESVGRTAPPKYVSATDALKSIRIGGFRWQTSGFGTIMIATFTLYNDNPFPIKDVVVTCIHSTNSDTVIDRNTRTIYEKISARGFIAVPELNMGFIHSAASSSRCAPTDFSRM